MIVRTRSLSVRLALSFGLFVVLGSVMLMAWLYAVERAQSLRVFADTARANADFVKTARLPLTERTSDALGRVLGFEVVFIEKRTDPLSLNVGGESVPEELFGLCRQHIESPVRFRSWEAVLLPVSGETQMWFVRRTAPLWSALNLPRVFLVLGVFWCLALALAVTLAQGIVRPLRRLTDRLPHIGSDPDATLPGAERSDEIGALARAYLDTRAQLATERALRERAERLALLGRMATGLAHEIHNPLSAIRMHGQLLESATPAELADTARESLPSMLGETAKIESLVNQWMFLARPEPPKVSPVALHTVVEQAAKAHEPAARHGGVEIVLEVPQDLSVQADARRLSQAVSNVIVNAIQAMSDGGVLRISGERRGSVACLRFSDAGKGFSTEALNRGSELFFSEKEGGMGIGLSVATEVLKAHGGAIRMENALAGGAIVTFEFPQP